MNTLDQTSQLMELYRCGLLTTDVLELYRFLGTQFDGLERIAKKSFAPIWNKYIIPVIRKAPEITNTIYFAGVDLEIKRMKKWEYVLTFSNEGNDPQLSLQWKGSRFSVIGLHGNCEQLANLLKIFCEQAKKGDFEIKT